VYTFSILKKSKNWRRLEVSVKKFILLFCLVGLFTQYSCSLLIGGSKTVTIEDVGWYIENVASDRWAAESEVKPSLTYSFEVFFKEDLSASDIEYVRIYLPDNSGSYWTIDHDRYFHADTNSVGGSVRYWYGANPKELPIGELTAEILLTNGKSDTYSFIMGKPGSTSTEGYSYVYSKEDEATPTYPASSAPAVMRPTVESLSLSGGQLLTTFTVKGNNVRNGWIWLYDANGDYVGRSVHFFNQLTELSSTKFSSGSFQNASDSQNTLALSESDIYDGSGNAIGATALNSIQHCRVFTTDGGQYSGHSAIQYDYRAMSSYY